MGIKNAIQEVGDQGIVIVEWLWEKFIFLWSKYPLYTFIVLFGFFILIILALRPRRTVHYYKPYQQNKQQTP